MLMTASTDRLGLAVTSYDDSAHLNATAQLSTVSPHVDNDDADEPDPLLLPVARSSFYPLCLLGSNTPR